MACQSDVAKIRKLLRRSRRVGYTIVNNPASPTHIHRAIKAALPSPSCGINQSRRAIVCRGCIRIVALKHTSESRSSDPGTRSSASVGTQRRVICHGFRIVQNLQDWTTIAANLRRYFRGKHSASKK